MEAAPKVNLSTVREFTRLAVERRLRNLEPASRARLDLLENVLRQGIDGAKVMPRQFDAPPTVEATHSAPPKQPVPAAQASRTRPGSGVRAPRAREHSSSGRAIREVHAAAIPSSEYTPPIAPSYMEDWYGDDLARAEVGQDERPKSVISAAGISGPTPSSDAQVLLGILPDLPVASAPTSVETEPAARRPVIINWLAGGTLRGQTSGIEPDQATLKVLEDGGKERIVACRDVLALFFSLRKGETTNTTPSDVSVVITLVNGREVAGTTNNANDPIGVDVVPHQKRGNVDRVWIPRHAIRNCQPR